MVVSTLRPSRLPALRRPNRSKVVLPAVPDIATVIPTFRRPEPLVEALKSVLAQEVDVEIVVVDDSPEQSARDAVASLNAKQITYLANPTPTGGWPSRVRNLGWPRTQAPLIHFLDDDDLVPEGHYRRALQAMQRNPDAGVVFGRIAAFGDAEALEHEVAFFQASAARANHCQRFGRKWGFAAEQLFKQTMLVCSASLTRRRVVERIGGFDPQVRLAEDIDYHARAFREGGAAFIDDVTLHYRITSTSLMHSNHDISQVKASYAHMFKRYQATHGRADFLALKVFAKTLLKAA
jgi:GT2 family glycosyltransferase